jgi:hypothetical protein
MLRIHTRAPDLDAFIERYSKLIDGDVIILFTDKVERVGSQVDFSIFLSGGHCVLRGRGTVRRVRKSAPLAMELEFVPLDQASADVVEFIQVVRGGVLPGEDTACESPLRLPALAPEDEVVPANPFSGISDGALGHFVDNFEPGRHRR